MKLIATNVILSLLLFSTTTQAFTTPTTTFLKSHTKLYVSKDVEEVASQEIKRTAAHLEKLKQQFNDSNSSTSNKESDVLYKELIQRPASVLKQQCQELRLSTKGRKPDLAQRLAAHLSSQDDEEEEEEEDVLEEIEAADFSKEAAADLPSDASFAGLETLSAAATSALHKASFLHTPTPIQSVAVAPLYNGESAVLHASTGSGKTLTYLLPITERLWSEREENEGIAIILTPTRELAAQVAGVAKVLSPPNTVRFISSPTNLLNPPSSKEKGEVEYYGGRVDNVKRKGDTRVIVGSAKCIYNSLFGKAKSDVEGKKEQRAYMTKMEGKVFLGSVRWLVMDEVDRLLHVKKSRMDKMSKRKHEKPAAVLTSAITRLTLGSTQIIAASATVGRPLRRELARVLGLPSNECPPVLRGVGDEAEMDNIMESGEGGRAVTIPDTVRHYVLPTDGSSSGAILTSAALMVRSMQQKSSSTKALFVLSKNCGMTIHNTLGVLRHFGVAEPKSLLDVLEADGTDLLIEVHRRVSGASGLGESNSQLPQKSTSSQEEEDEGYVLVCNEDSVRGLHLDALQTVIVVGRPAGPDEYTHIAGRTGRAGNRGNVVNVVSFEQAAALTSWEKMLNIDFIPLEEGEEI
mmetsp:Transcript_20594/g.30577  ORF Transcript_20594/g.30577 Transcript_20594/m.30577 type:complete len:633 (-) Transcript_20594:128-2026(-)